MSERKREMRQKERGESKREGERGYNITSTTMYLLNVKRNYNFIAYGM